MRGQPLLGQRHSWGHLCPIPTRFGAAPAPRCRCPNNEIWTYRKDLKSSRTYQSLVGPVVVVTALDTAPISNYRHVLIKYVYVSATCAISLLGQLLLDVLSSSLARTSARSGHYRHRSRQTAVVSWISRHGCFCVSIGLICCHWDRRRRLPVCQPPPSMAGLHAASTNPAPRHLLFCVFIHPPGGHVRCRCCRF